MFLPNHFQKYLESIRLAYFQNIDVGFPNDTVRNSLKKIGSKDPSGGAMMAIHWPSIGCVISNTPGPSPSNHPAIHLSSLPANHLAIRPNHWTTGLGPSVRGGFLRVFIQPELPSGKLT